MLEEFTGLLQKCVIRIGREQVKLGHSGEEVRLNFSTLELIASVQ